DFRWCTSRTRPGPPTIGWRTSVREFYRGGQFLPTGSRRGSSTTSSSAMTRRIRLPVSRPALSICTASTSSPEVVGNALRATPQWLVIAATVVVLIVVGGFGSRSIAADGVNLVAARNGGQVIKFTSQLDGGGRADQLINEHEGSGGWAAGDNTLP